MPMGRSYATFYMLTISMFALSVIVSEIFSLKMYMTLTLTFRMYNICQSQGYMRLSMYVLAMALFVLGQSVTVYEMYSIIIFTLKMKVKDVGDFDENWHSNLPCRRAYVCKI